MITAQEAQTASQAGTITQEELEMHTYTYVFDSNITEATKTGKTAVDIYVPVFGQTESSIILNLLLLERYGYGCTLNGDYVTVSWEDAVPEDYTKGIDTVQDIAEAVWARCKEIIEESQNTTPVSSS